MTLQDGKSLILILCELLSEKNNVDAVCVLGCVMVM